MKGLQIHIRILAASLSLCLGIPGRALALRGTEPLETGVHAGIEERLSPTAAGAAENAAILKAALRTTLPAIFGKKDPTPQQLNDLLADDLTPQRAAKILKNFRLSGGAQPVINVVKTVKRELALNPNSSLFDFYQWLDARYVPSAKEINRLLYSNRLTGRQFLAWIDEFIRPLRPDFQPSIPIDPEATLIPTQIYRTSTDIFYNVIVPRGYVVSASIFENTALSIGRITQRRTETTPAGRQIEVLAVEERTPGAFGSGMAFQKVVIDPAGVGRIHKKTLQTLHETWQLASRGRIIPHTPDFDPANPGPGYFQRIWWPYFSGHSLEEAITLQARDDLNEEFAHSDTHDYFWRYMLAQGRLWIESYQEKARLILRQQNRIWPLLMDLLGDEFQNNPRLLEEAGRAVVEVEAKLKAIQVSERPSLTLMEELAGTIFPMAAGAPSEPPAYPLARQVILRYLGYLMFGHAQAEREEWAQFLNESTASPEALEHFHWQLKEAARVMYEAEFLSPEEREEMIRNAVRPETPQAGAEEKNVLVSPGALATPGMLNLLIKAAPYLSPKERGRVAVYTENPQITPLLRDELGYRVFTRFSDVQAFRPGTPLSLYTAQEEWLLRGQLPQVTGTVILTPQNFRREFAALLAVLNVPLTLEQLGLPSAPLEQAA